MGSHPAQVAGVDRHAPHFGSTDVRNHAMLDVSVESTMWVRRHDAVEADVRRSLEAHEGVVAGLVDLLKRVANLAGESPRRIPRPHVHLKSWERGNE